MLMEICIFGRHFPASGIGYIRRRPLVFWAVLAVALVSGINMATTSARAHDGLRHEAGKNIRIAAAGRWVCRATSSTGSWGLGWHAYSKAYASQRALVECALRTPSNRTCYVRACWRE